MHPRVGTSSPKFSSMHLLTEPNPLATPGWDAALWPPRGADLRNRLRSYEILPSEELPTCGTAPHR